MSHRAGLFLSLLGAVTAVVVLFPRQASAGESSWYAVARFGETESEARLGSIHPKWIDDTVSSGAVEVGYAVNRYLSIQAGYHDFGEHDGYGSPCRQEDDACIERLATIGLCIEGTVCTEVLVPLAADIWGFSLSLAPTWPVTDRFSVYGKAGVISWDASVSARSFGGVEDLSGEGLIAAVGARYDFPSGFGLLIEREEIDLDAGSTTAGVRWRF